MTCRVQATPPKEKRKPILCLGFDGVLHSYTSGWQGADVVSDPPVEGMVDFLVAALQVFDVQIFSSRSHQEGGREAMIGWLVENGLPKGALEAVFEDDPMGYDLWESRIKFPREKPPAMVGIDDRALTFDGTFPEIADLLAFEPWNKKAEPDLGLE